VKNLRQLKTLGIKGIAMNVTKIIIVFVFSLSVVGCSSTGGIIGGLFPAPKFIKGKIENDVYTSKNEDFSVAIPHKDGTYEYTYMQIKEQYNKLGAYISFGPAAMDQSIYRLEIGKKLSLESKDVVFKDAVDAIIANYTQQLEAGYNSKLELVKKEKTTINGVPSYNISLKQSVQNQVLNHEILVLNYNSLAAAFWVQTSSTGSKKASVNALQFAESFRVLQ